jgi:NADH dehydrogenase/NADH:ubiquinone oxidoreductase subunit G
MLITIDDKSCVCERGEYLIDIAARNGIVIPTLCHHEGLPGQGCCRVCIVEVETDGRRSIVTACVYPVERECAVFTNSGNISRQRSMILCCLHNLAPESSEIAHLCEKYGAPEYERLTKRAGEKCILCGLCVKACECLGTGAISTVNRGIDKAVTTPYGEPSVVCVGCASCAKVCPTGAIAVTETEKKRKIWNKTFPLRSCKSCGKPIGTSVELKRSAAKSGAEIPVLCEMCRRKAIANVMTSTYGHPPFPQGCPRGPQPPEGVARKTQSS